MPNLDMGVFQAEMAQHFRAELNVEVRRAAEGNAAMTFGEGTPHQVSREQPRIETARHERRARVRQQLPAHLRQQLVAFVDGMTGIGAIAMVRRRIMLRNDPLPDFDDRARIESRDFLVHGLAEQVMSEEQAGGHGAAVGVERELRHRTEERKRGRAYGHAAARMHEQRIDAEVVRRTQQRSIGVEAQRSAVVQAPAQLAQARARCARRGEQRRRFVLDRRSRGQPDDGCDGARAGHELPRRVAIHGKQDETVRDLVFVNFEVRPEILQHADCSLFRRPSDGGIRARHSEQVGHEASGKRAGAKA
ncbi:MAG TPA: hypothetical protein VGI14_17200 [Casimicrobiaceae bacterium]